jgi:outer membrane receptor protein involved in Fe transport
MRTLRLAFLLSVLLYNASAQSIKSGFPLKGRVIDSLSGKPLPYVTIQLQDGQTLSPLRSAISKEDGTFDILAPENKKLFLVLAFTGYTDKIFSVVENTAHDFGIIRMGIADKKMEEVTVVAARPVIKRDLDGITYDVAADPESPALTALDMMRKVPLLSVDASDNIKLKGKGNYKILINGKESSLVAKNPADVLRAMPATNIEKIEVITTPPAKYDAEGLAGIINIITKRKIQGGYNVGINGRYNTVYGPGINVNGNYKKGKFGASGYVGYGVHVRQTTSAGNDQHFYTDNSDIAQSTVNSNGFHNSYMNVELNYEFDSLNLLSGSFEYYHGGDDQNSNQLSNTLDGNQSLNQSYRLLSRGTGSFGGLDAGINYQKGFKRNKNQQLNFSYKYGYSPNTQNNSNIITDTFNFSLPSYNQYNKSGNRDHTIQVDYVQPIKKLTVEAGGKIILKNNFSNFNTDVYNDTAKEYVPNPAQTNDFNYQQDVYSVYNSYQRKWTKWNVKAGLRLEHTGIRANFVSEASTVDQDYNNLIPSLSLQRTFTTGSFTLGYTDRISRPDISQLNPFVDLSNPKFISTGNPDLQPETSHNFELTYSSFSKNSITIGLSYSFSNNSIQSVTSLRIDSIGNNQTDTVTISSYQNLGTNKNLGLNFNLNYNKIQNLNISFNGQLAHVWLTGTYNGQYYKNDGNAGNAFLNAGYRFAKVYRVGIDAAYFSGEVNLQGKSSAGIFSSYVFSRSFMNKKLTISFVANSPFAKYYTFRSSTATPDFYQASYHQIVYRSFNLRFNFKFGKLETEKKNGDQDDSKEKGG